MMSTLKMVIACGGLLAGAAIVCPVCADRADARAQTTAATPRTDTATVRLHISGMTCGTCPVTAKLALRKLTGVYSATVTLDDSLGVVRYDPHRVTPRQIAAHLVRITGYRATVLPTRPAAEDRS